MEVVELLTKKVMERKNILSKKSNSPEQIKNKSLSKSQNQLYEVDINSKKEQQKALEERLLNEINKRLKNIITSPLE